MAGLEIGGMVIGTVSLSAQLPHVFRVVPEYLDRFRNARSDVEAIQKELVSLNLCVRDLERDFNQYDDDTKTDVRRAMQSCEVTIKNILDFVHKFDIGRFRSRVKWSAMDKDEITRYRTDLERHKQHLNITLSKASLKTMFEARRSLSTNTTQTAQLSNVVDDVHSNVVAMRDELRSVRIDICNQLLAMSQNNQTLYQEQLRQVESLVEGIRARATPQEQADLFLDEAIDVSTPSISNQSLSGTDFGPELADVARLSNTLGGQLSISTDLLRTNHESSVATHAYVDRIAKLEQELAQAKSEAKKQADRVALQKHFLDQRNAENQDLVMKIQRLESSSGYTAPSTLSPPYSPEEPTKHQPTLFELDTRSIMSARIETSQDFRYTEPPWARSEYGVSQTENSSRRTASEPIPHDAGTPKKTVSSPESANLVPIPLIEFTLWDEQTDNPRIESPGDVYTVKPKAWVISDVGPWSKDNLFVPEEKIEAYMEDIERAEQRKRKLFVNGDPFINIKRYLSDLLKTKDHYPSNVFTNKSFFLQTESKRLEDSSTIYEEKLKHGDSIWLVMRDSRTPLKDLVIEDLRPSTSKYHLS